ncbi:MAG: hypothetical protein Q7T93_13275 [Methylobacterium sp.]|uniref:hypothetical protein n=1 Tax=Methylobacterium sp. TaxID=409 RepID=UPI00271CC4CA|nr:hypothetical protein [Methylobacterium sp.]MDO9427788.1 hypothetical protein [Methylobacterium sp.]
MAGWLKVINRAQDAEVRRMLGEWVSECEPQLFYGPEGIAGLAVAGDRHYDGPHPIIVHARLVEIPMTGGGEVIHRVVVAMPLAEARRRSERQVDPFEWAGFSKRRAPHDSARQAQRVPISGRAGTAQRVGGAGA